MKNLFIAFIAPRPISLFTPVQVVKLIRALVIYHRPIIIALAVGIVAATIALWRKRKRKEGDLWLMTLVEGKRGSYIIIRFMIAFETN